MAGRACNRVARFRLGQAKQFRHLSEDLSVSGSGRRLPAEVNMSSAVEVRRPDFVNRSPRHPVADVQMKRAPNKKECSALTLSRRRRPSTSSNEAARLPQPITARDTGSRKAERRDNQKKRHRQGRDNFAAIRAAAPERKTPEPLSFQA